MLQKLFLIALAGSLGTLARFGLSGFVQRITGPHFPWGTFSVNVIGCYLFGVIWAMTENRGLMSDYTRIIILVGFMGAFTTFSTYIFESSQMLRDSQWLAVLGNLMANNIVGFLFLYLGIQTTKLI